MAIDWKKVAADRLREIRSLRLRLRMNRETLATRAVQAVQHELHARCLTSVSGPEWAKAFENIKRRIAEE